MGGLYVIYHARGVNIEMQTGSKADDCFMYVDRVVMTEIVSSDMKIFLFSRKKKQHVEREKTDGHTFV